ncbi:nodulation protein NfeD [Maricaulis sp.]|uniref:NfeD family protein n=1 Tax=Maricaulis sp. TaxID=1486257 RepID=UPI00262813CE|nr:nodulation protein NfeD [Maricaulis sp.]
MSRFATLGGRAGPGRLQMQALAAALFLAGLLIAALAAAQEPGGARTAYLIEIDGAIGPATASHVSRTLDEAADRGGAIAVIRMDTPGGLDTSMRDIIQAILASPVPVAVHVAPSGSRAASAGTYILYSAHIAAMAPGTTLGAATPVQIGGGSLPFGAPQDEGDAQDNTGDDARTPTSPTAPSTAMEAKAVNDAVAYIRSLADLRGRNADWAERAVREAASLPAAEAVEANVADFIADDIDTLFAAAHGREVMVAGRPVILNMEGLSVERLEPRLREQILSVITDPNVAVILMMIGVYGLFFEFLNPGALYPGTIGAICLLLGLYAMAVLPVTYAGVALILLGLALMIAEAFAPSFGILGIGGVASFVIGAAILIEPGTPGFEISWPLIAGTSAAMAGLGLVIARVTLRSFRRPVSTGREEMIGAHGVTEPDWSGTRGHVFVHGERWRAVSRTPLVPGQPVRVTGVNGLTLTVAAETSR